MQLEMPSVNIDFDRCLNNGCRFSIFIYIYIFFLDEKLCIPKRYIL